MTQDAMRCALTVGPEWRVIWCGADLLPAVEHWCTGLCGPGRTYVSKQRGLLFDPTPKPGIEAARCERCQIAWVRAVGAAGRSAAAR